MHKFTPYLGTEAQSEYPGPSDGEFCQSDADPLPGLHRSVTEHDAWEEML